MTIPVIKLIPPEYINGKTYYADSDGHIRNNKGKILKFKYSPYDRTGPSTHGGNYYHVSIGGKDRNVHLLVCAAFWGMPEPGQVCHHFDGNRFNNRPENLIWLDPKEHPLFDRAVRQGIIYIHVDGLAHMDYELSHHCEY